MTRSRCGKRSRSPRSSASRCQSRTLKSLKLRAMSTGPPALHRHRQHNGPREHASWHEPSVSIQGNLRSLINGTDHSQKTTHGDTDRRDLRYITLCILHKYTSRHVVKYICSRFFPVTDASVVPGSSHSHNSYSTVYTRTVLSLRTMET